MVYRATNDQQRPTIALPLTTQLFCLAGTTAECGASQPPQSGPIPESSRIAARQELASTGVSWDYDHFFNAIINKDYDTIELFAKGGMKLASNPYSHVFWFNPGYYDPKTVSIIKKNNFDPLSECPLPTLRSDIDNPITPFQYDDLFHTQPRDVLDDYKKSGQPGINFSLISDICVGPAVIEKLKSTLAEAKAYVAKFKDDKAATYGNWLADSEIEISDCERLLAYLQGRQHPKPQ